MTEDGRRERSTRRRILKGPPLEMRTSFWLDPASRRGRTGPACRERAAPCRGETGALPRLFLPRQEGLGSHKKLNIGKLGGQLDAVNAAFWSAAALEGQQILVTEVRGQFLQVRLESHRFIDAEIIGFGSARLGELAEIILPAKGAKPAAAQVPAIGVVDRPNIDVFFRSEEH